MNTITTTELNAILVREANRDMGIARRDAKRPDCQPDQFGYVGICGTKVGNIELRYHPTTKTYSVIGLNNGKTVLAPTAAGGAVQFLSSIYFVELADTVVVN